MRPGMLVKVGKRGRWPLLAAWAVLVGLAAGPAPGQEAEDAPPAATAPAAALPTPTPREQELEARVRQLEQMVHTLSGRLGQVEAQGAPAAPAAAPLFGPPGTGGGSGAGGAGPGGNAGDAFLDAGGSASPEGPDLPAAPRFDMPFTYPNKDAVSRFGRGFQIATPDDEFLFQFNNLTQVDYRGYQDTPRLPLNEMYHSTFGFPRQWWIFSGHLTKPIEYFAVPAFGFDAVNLLDCFVNVKFDERFQFKIGRYKTPFTYEFYMEPIQGLATPERSLFFNNFALNRDVGAMLWGNMLEKRFDYAVGVFNGSRNYFVDRNSSPEVVALLNFKPWANAKDSILENLSFGGSVMSGNEMNVPIPRVLRTNVATTGAGFFGVPFLAFNSNAVESGPRVLWDLHAALYYRQLSLMAEWGSGFQNYATTAAAFQRTQVPVSGYYVQAAYFLTGETVSGRGMVQPNRNFDLRPGKFGTGALEPSVRYSYLHVGDEVFTSNLSDPKLWSNDAGLLDVGMNWYWNAYLKVYLGWEHAMFGSPVQVDPAPLSRFQLTNDMYWLRFQIYF